MIEIFVRDSASTPMEYSYGILLWNTPMEYSYGILLLNTPIEYSNRILLLNTGLYNNTTFYSLILLCPIAFIVNTPMEYFTFFNLLVRFDSRKYEALSESIVQPQSFA